MKFEKFDQRWTFTQLVKTEDPVSGEEIYSATGSTFVAWCEFRGLKGAETFQVAGDVSTAKGMLITRYVPGVTVTAKGWQVTGEDSRVWDVVGEPTMIGRREGLSIPVECRS